MSRIVAFVLGGALLMTAAVQAEPATALFDGRTVQIENSLADPTDLWVTPADLPRVNGFELKPEGICQDEICIIVRENDHNPLVITRDGQQWVNVSELARRLNQAVAYDGDNRVWSFGPVPALQSGYVDSAEAPDFELNDREGNTVRLSDFRGKKVLLMTWASW